MTERIIRFRGFTVTTPLEWKDITAALEDPNMPFTVARGDSGGGALQFSPALYRRGPIPSPSSKELFEMAIELGSHRGLGEPFDATMFDKPIMGAAVSYRCEDSLVRVWYVSRSGNIMLVTFVCDWERQSEEIADCERIVRTVDFGTNNGSNE